MLSNDLNRSQEIGVPDPALAREMLTRFLEEHPEVSLRQLATSAGLTYDALQKYRQGLRPPPSAKWNAVYRAMSSYSARGDDNFQSASKSTPLEHQDGLFSGRVDQDSLAVFAHPVAETEKPTIVNDRNLYSEAPSSDVSDYAQSPEPSPSQEIFLPVHGFVRFFNEEIEVINHPAFQRLAGLHQLGLAYVVYRGATHKRLEHCLGTVWAVQKIIDAVEHSSHNRPPIAERDRWVVGTPLTIPEKRFTRLTALLHDIGHVAFGHMFEDELGILRKHDKAWRLDKVFAKTSWFGAEHLPLQQVVDQAYQQFLPQGWGDSPSNLVKSILLHPSAYGPVDGRCSDVDLARSGFRVSICHDMVGNTICADILDYIYRDWYHIGKPQYFDDRICHYMEIRAPTLGAIYNDDGYPEPSSSDRFVISLGSRPRLRTDGVSNIMGLLEKRYELSEAVIFHRTKMAVSAMLERALALTLPVGSAPPDELATEDPSESHRIALEDWLLDNSEEMLLPALIKGNGLVPDANTGKQSQSRTTAARIASMIACRKLYKEVLTITNDDQLPSDEVHRIKQIYAESKDAAKNRAQTLELLERDLDLPRGSIVMYCPDARMNRKIAEVSVFVQGDVYRFDEYDKDNGYALSAGRLDAQLKRHARLWRIAFFVNPDLAKRGEEFLDLIREVVLAFALGSKRPGERDVAAPVRAARSAVRHQLFHLHQAEVLLEPRLAVSRSSADGLPARYPTGIPSLLSFLNAPGQ